MRCPTQNIPPRPPLTIREQEILDLNAQLRPVKLDELIEWCAMLKERYGGEMEVMSVGKGGESLPVLRMQATVLYAKPPMRTVDLHTNRYGE